MADHPPAQQTTAPETTATAATTASTTARPSEPDNSNKMESQNENIPPSFPSSKMASGFLSITSFFLSLLLLAYGIYLLYMRHYDCESILDLPRVQTWTGVSLILMFLLSNAAVFAIARHKAPIAALIVVLVPLIFMLFSGLAFKGLMASESLPATPVWFKLKVRDDTNWNDIKSCIYDRGTCYELVFRTLRHKSNDFGMKKMSSVEAGCCKPPASCGMEYVNATYWRRKGRGGGDVALREADGEVLEGRRYRDRDCELWRNDRSVLCYDCETCKEGFIKSLKKEWSRLGVFLVIMSVFLITTHLLLFLATMFERFKS